MHGVTNQYKNVVALDGRRWKARVAVSDKVFQDDEILSILVDEATMKGESFEVGSVVSNKLTLEILQNELLVYDDVKVTPTLSLETSPGVYEDVPMGVYRVADYKRDRHKVTLTCYDDMSKLEHGYFPTANPTSVANHVAQIKAASGISILGAFPADSVKMPEGSTLREAIGYIAGYMGGFARFDRQGNLKIGGYSGAVTEVSTGALYAAEGLQSGLEYVNAADLKPVLDENPGAVIEMTFQLRTSKPGPVFLYTLGKHTIGSWYAEAGPDWQTFRAVITPDVIDAAATQSALSFYAVYGSGSAVSVRNLSFKKIGQVQQALEYVALTDLVPEIEAKPGEPITLDIQIRTSKPGPVFLYSLGKHSIGQWYADGTTDWQRYTLTVLPEEVDPGAETSLLSLYGVYGSGISISASLGEAQSGSGIDYGAYSFKIIDGTQYHSLKLAEQDVSIGKVSGQVGNEIVTVGALGNEVQIDCPFMTRARLEQLYAQLKSIRYRPYEIRGFRGDPAIEAGDQIALIDEFGVQHTTIVSHQQIRYTSSVSHDIRGKGLTAQAQSMQPKSRVDKEFTKIYAEQLAVRDVLAEKVTTQELDAWKATVTELYATKAHIDNALVNYLKVTDAEIKYATIENLTAVDGKFDQLSSVYASIVDLNVVTGHITSLQSAQADIQILLAGKIEATDITAEFLQAKLATITTAWITNAMIDTATASRLMIDQANIKNTAILDAYIKNLSASVITTGQLDAGRIAANSITLDKLESGIGGKLGIVAQDEITLQITGAMNELSVGGGANLTPGLPAVSGVEIISWDISGAMDGTDRAISFDLQTSAPAKVMVYTKGDYEIGRWYADTDTTARRYGMGVKLHKVSDTGVTTLYFYAVYGSGVTISVTNRKIETGSIVTGLDMDAYVPKTGVKTAISLSQEGVLITGKHLKIDALTTIDEAVIQTAHLTDALITTAKIADLAVDSAKIDMEAVDTSKIKDLSVTSAKIAVAAIGTTQIADASITNAKIVELSAAKITTGTLSVERLEIRGSTKSIIYEINNISGALQSQNMETINGEALTPRSITADRIVANEITANEIAARAITANEMALNTITAESGIIADAAIISAKIADAAITNAKIDRVTAQRLVVETTDIKDAAIVTAKIQDLAVTDAKIANITAEKIVADWIESGHIKTGSLTTSVIAAEDWANLDLSSNTSIQLAVKVNTVNLLDGEVVKSGLEYVGYADLADVVTAGRYTLSFDLDVSQPGDVLLYSTGRYAIGQYYINATPGQKRYYAVLDITDGDLTKTESILSLYGIYGSGMTLHVGKVMLSKGLTSTRDFYANTEAFVRRDSILAAINLSGETVTIDGKWLHINAQTTIDSASIDVAAIRNLTVNAAQITSVDASKITVGEMDGARIKAKSIVTNHLAADVGKALDLTGNRSITLAVDTAMAEVLDGDIPKNLIRNGSFESGLPDGQWRTNGATVGWTGIRGWNYISLGTGLDSYARTNLMQFAPDTSYFAYFQIYSGAVGDKIALKFKNADGAVMYESSYTTEWESTAWGAVNWPITPNEAMLAEPVYLEVSNAQAVSGTTRLTRFQIEVGTEHTGYERNAPGLVAMINLDRSGVQIIGSKVTITGETHIENGVIGTAHISNAAITNAKIADATITNAKIVDLSADKIRTGVLKALTGNSMIDLDRNLFVFENAEFISYIGSESRLEIKDGTVYSTDGFYHTKLERGGIKFYPTGGEYDAGKYTLITHQTPLKTSSMGRYYGIPAGFSSGWTAGEVKTRTPNPSITPYMDSKARSYEGIFETGSVTIQAGYNSVAEYTLGGAYDDIRTLTAIQVTSFVDGLIFSLHPTPFYVENGAFKKIRFVVRNVSGSTITSTLRISLSLTAPLI